MNRLIEQQNFYEFWILTGTKVEADIKRLSRENYSYRQIKNKLKEEDLDISVSSICRLLKILESSSRR